MKILSKINRQKLALTYFLCLLLIAIVLFVIVLTITNMSDQAVNILIAAAIMISFNFSFFFCPFIFKKFNFPLFNFVFDEKKERKKQIIQKIIWLYGTALLVPIIFLLILFFLNIFKVIETASFVGITVLIINFLFISIINITYFYLVLFIEKNQMPNKEIGFTLKNKKN